jgi:hypothetical protein
MKKFRYGAILFILIALIGGIKVRFLNPAFGQRISISRSEIVRTFVYSGLNIRGSFEEPLGDSLLGFEVFQQGCAYPLAILLVPASISAIDPAEYRYREGKYNISYVYNEKVYPERQFSYLLSGLNVFYRFQYIFGISGIDQFSYYLKVWSPAECINISTSDILKLANNIHKAFIGVRKSGTSS